MMFIIKSNLTTLTNFTVYKKVQNTWVSLEKSRCYNWFLSNT